MNRPAVPEHGCAMGLQTGCKECVWEVYWRDLRAYDVAQARVRCRYCNDCLPVFHQFRLIRIAGSCMALRSAGEHGGLTTGRTYVARCGALNCPQPSMFTNSYAWMSKFAGSWRGADVGPVRAVGAVAGGQGRRQPLGDGGSRRSGRRRPAPSWRRLSSTGVCAESLTDRIERPQQQQVPACSRCDV